jgi:hypothetical protein
MISKKLLSEVLGLKNPHPLKIEDGKLYLYKELGQNITTINIYDLAHMCKEWALQYNFYISSEVKKENSFSGLMGDDIWEHILLPFTADTEPEAIFKACEWILENNI